MGTRSTKKEVQQVLDGKSLNFYTTKRTNNPDSILLAGLAGKFFNGTNWRSTISTGNIGTLPLTSTNESSNVTGTTGLPSANHRYGVNLWTSIAYGDGLGDNYGFIAIGYFTPPTTGTYTFYTSSDDGSGVWIGELALPGASRTSTNAVLNNGLGSGQGNTKRSGTISLTGGVRYPIRIVHEEGVGGDNLTFSWSGPSITETTSLSTYFSTPATVSGQLTGNYLSSASSLVLNLDAGNSGSYPGSGTTWFDLSGYIKNGTLVNGVGYDNNVSSLVFDGVDDYAYVSSPSPFSGTQLFTFEIWVNLTSITGNFGGLNKCAWLFSGGTGLPEFAILSANNTSFTPNTIAFGNGSGGTTGSLSISVSSLITTGNWYQIVLVRSASNAQTVYLNGSSIGTGNVSNSFSDGIINFGGLPSNTNYSGY